MNAQVLIILAFVPALSAQLFAIASPGGGLNAGGNIGCNGYLRFAARAALSCGNPTGAGVGGPPCCPCPGSPNLASLYPMLGVATTPSTFILNACVPACCPTGIVGPTMGSNGIGTGALSGGLLNILGKK